MDTMFLRFMKERKDKVRAAGHDHRLLQQTEFELVAKADLT